MTIETEIQSRIRELEKMRLGPHTAMELHRRNIFRVQRQEDFLFNQRVEAQRQELLAQLNELESEEGDLTMRTSPMLFIPRALPIRKLVRRRRRITERW